RGPRVATGEFRYDALGIPAWPGGEAMPLLEVLDVHKRYGALVALAGVSFAVQEGEMFGLLGPNGVGKTTLLSIVAGLMEATSGEVRLLGRRVGPRDREARRQIGVVPQELAVYGPL